MPAIGRVNPGIREVVLGQLPPQTVPESRRQQPPTTREKEVIFNQRGWSNFGDHRWSFFGCHFDWGELLKILSSSRNAGISNFVHKPLFPSEKCTLFFAQFFALIMHEKKVLETLQGQSAKNSTFCTWGMLRSTWFKLSPLSSRN
jgi:hypothetical protein